MSVHYRKSPETSPFKLHLRTHIARVLSIYSLSLIRLAVVNTYILSLLQANMHVGMYSLDRLLRWSDAY